MRIDGGGHLAVTRANAPTRTEPERVEFPGWRAQPPIVAWRDVLVVYLLQERGPRNSRVELAFLDASTLAVVDRLPLGECADGILYCEQAHLCGPVLAVTAEFAIRDEMTQSECHLVHLGSRRRVGIMRASEPSTFFDARGEVAWSVQL